VTSLYTKGFLPYTLRWRFRATEVEASRRLAIDAEGDFLGRGVWTLAPAPAGGTDVAFDWRIRAEKPLLKALSFVLKPIFSANHRWAMDKGLESLLLELRRREATTDEERGRIPPPPGPTFPHNLTRPAEDAGAAPTTASRSPIAVFLFLTLAQSAVFWAAIIGLGRLSAGGGLFVRALMWSPGLAALLTCALCRLSVRSLGWRWGETRYQVQSYFIPFFYSLIAYVAVWTLGLGGFPSRRFLERAHAEFSLGFLSPGGAAAVSVLLTAAFGFPGSVASALGEEIGWRGLLLPRLHARLGFTAAALLSGLVWALWHTPILLFADYNAGTPAYFSLSCFTVLVVSGSVIFAWYRLRSGSLWTAAFLHASHNLFIQAIFTPLTEDTGRSAYVIDEFGVAVPLVMALFALYFWSRRNELPPEASPGAKP
jgi:membrane protease YdiL (CAAX protease family)